MGYEITIRNWKLQNLGSSVDSKMMIRLEGISCGPHRHFCRYEPEIFPGMVYRLTVSREQATPAANKDAYESKVTKKKKAAKGGVEEIVLLIFAKGKVVMTGAKTIKEIDDAWNHIYPMLVEHQISK